MVEVLRTVNPILWKSLRTVLEIVGNFFFSIISLKVCFQYFKKKLQNSQKILRSKLSLKSKNDCHDHILSSTSQCLKFQQQKCYHICLPSDLKTGIVSATSNSVLFSF